jgi:hypothetical protein
LVVLGGYYTWFGHYSAQLVSESSSQAPHARPFRVIAYRQRTFDGLGTAKNPDKRDPRPVFRNQSPVTIDRRTGREQREPPQLEIFPAKNWKHSGPRAALMRAHLPARNAKLCMLR